MLQMESQSLILIFWATEMWGHSRAKYLNLLLAGFCADKIYCLSSQLRNTLLFSRDDLTGGNLASRLVLLPCLC